MSDKIRNLIYGAVLAAAVLAAIRTFFQSAFPNEPKEPPAASAGTKQ